MDPLVVFVHTAKDRALSSSLWLDMEGPGQGRVATAIGGFRVENDVPDCPAPIGSPRLGEAKSFAPRPRINQHPGQGANPGLGAPRLVHLHDLTGGHCPASWS